MGAASDNEPNAVRPPEHLVLTDRILSSHDQGEVLAEDLIGIDELDRGESVALEEVVAKARILVADVERRTLKRAAKEPHAAASLRLVSSARQMDP